MLSGLLLLLLLAVEESAMMKVAMMMLGAAAGVAAQKDGVSQGPTIPAGCTTYNDGCNTCRCVATH